MFCIDRAERFKDNVPVNEANLVNKKVIISRAQKRPSGDPAKESEEVSPAKMIKIERLQGSNVTVKEEIKTEAEEDAAMAMSDQKDGDEKGSVAGGDNVNLPELQSLVTESNYIHSPHHWFNGCEYKCQVKTTFIYPFYKVFMNEVKSN